MTVVVELLTSPGCSRCASAAEELGKIIAAVGNDRIQFRIIDVVGNIDYAVSLGVVATPAIAIDGELVYTSMPRAAKIRRVLEDSFSDGRQ